MSLSLFNPLWWDAWATPLRGRAETEYFQARDEEPNQFCLYELLLADFEGPTLNLVEANTAFHSRELSSPTGHDLNGG